jgi:hypothetical protein
LKAEGHYPRLQMMTELLTSRAATLSKPSRQADGLSRGRFGVPKRITLLTSGLLLLLVGSPLLGQERNQALRQLRQEDRVLSPDLEIREFSGEFERWSKAVTVTAPGVEVFRWSTPASGTVAARWSVMDGPPGSGTSVLGSGSAGSAPEPGSVTAFRIDFSRVIPAGQPTDGATYWVILEPLDAARQAGPISAPVQVTYARQVDIGAFAGRGADVVATTQGALSKSTKLAFLRDLVANPAATPARATLEDLLKNGNVGFASEIRLTVSNSVVFPANLAPQESPHSLYLYRPSRVWGWRSDAPEGMARLIDPISWITLNYRLEPAQLYLLDIVVDIGGEGTLRLNPAHDCTIDLTSDSKELQVSGGYQHVVAVINSSGADCLITIEMSSSPPPSLHF